MSLAAPSPAAPARRVLIPAALPPFRAPAAAARRVAMAGPTMGTDWRVTAMAAADPAGLAAEIGAALDGIVAQMSHWLPDSDLCRFNRAAAGTWQALPEPFFAVLAAAQALARETGGACDPAIGRLVDLWGFGAGPRRDAPPDPQAIAAARACGGWQRLELDAAARRARQPGGLWLDLSAIAKGFAVDQVATLLERRGIDSYLVEIGGELRGRGVKPDGTPWWVALADPPGAALPETVIALHGLAVATTGDAERAFMHRGRRLSHSLDPRSGWPVPDGVAAVTVIHARCMQADALATALTVLGAEEGLAFAAARGIAARFVLRHAGSFAERASPAFAAMLE